MGGSGNQKISFGDYDFDFGSGITINHSNLVANDVNGLISLPGKARLGPIYLDMEWMLMIQIYMQTELLLRVSAQKQVKMAHQTSQQELFSTKQM